MTTHIGRVDVCDGNVQAGGGLEAAIEHCANLWVELEVVAGFPKLKNCLFHLPSQQDLWRTMYMMKVVRQMMLI